MGTVFDLTIHNDSNLSGNFCIYQRDPVQDAGPDFYSLAWFSKSAHPATELAFQWDVEYSLLWDESGILTPGAVAQFGREKDLDLSVPAKTASAISAKGGGGLVQTNCEVPAGKIGILTDNSIPERGVPVGIGVSGRPAFAMNALPNDAFTFQPHPHYWVAFGDFREGEVMDVDLIQQGCELVFDREHRAEVSLGRDLQWRRQV